MWPNQIGHVLLPFPLTEKIVFFTIFIFIYPSNPSASLEKKLEDLIKREGERVREREERQRNRIIAVDLVLARRISAIRIIINGVLLPSRLMPFYSWSPVSFLINLASESALLCLFSACFLDEIGNLKKEKEERNLNRLNLIV